MASGHNVRDDGELDEVERRAVEHLLRGEEEWKTALRAQARFLRVHSREPNIYGGVTNFVLPEKAKLSQLPPPGTSPIHGGVVRHPSLVYPGYFLLWLKDGNISALEATAQGDDEWPSHDKPDNFQFE
jgi:hypothetical protein